MAGFVGLALLSACSGPPSQPVAQHQSSPSASSTGGSAPSARSDVRGLAVTATVRAQLLRAAARSKGGLPAADFKGLEPGQTYYALDQGTGTYWAGAALVPGDDSRAAEASVQDNGSYDVFERAPGGSWHAFEVGLAGVGGTACPVRLPPAVLEAWGWPDGSCHPARGPGGAS